MPAPSQPSSNRCLFFRLPSELRNMIYLHVLRYENGLTIDYELLHQPVFYRSIDVQDNDLLPNPLSLVCRRLHNETRGLIFEANHAVSLYSVGFMPPSSYVFSHFTKYISKTVIQRLRRITISGEKNADAGIFSWNYMSSYLDNFKPFCNANPKTVVVVRFGRAAGIDDEIWLLYYLTIRTTIRRGLEDLKVGRPPIPETWVGRALETLGPVVFSRLAALPPNLKFSIFTKFPKMES